jgi:hypothetical protein
MPTSLDNGQRSPRKLLRAVVARLLGAEALNPKGGYMKGARYFLRNFTATAVREHLRSQIEDSGGSPEFDQERA